MTRISSFFRNLKRFSVVVWARYRALAFWLQAVIALLVIAIVFGAIKLTQGSAQVSADTALPTVALERVDQLSGGGNGVDVIGSVRSITEADVLAESGGTVTAVHGSVGESVPAGYLIAELDNASQRAAVLQAQGSYDAAVAGQAASSPTDIKATAQNTFATSFSTLDTLLKGDIDLFFGTSGGLGPQFLISPDPFDFTYFPKKRQALADAMTDWRGKLGTASSQDPQTLLDEADAVVKQAIALGNDIAQAATKQNTDATATQLTALAAARAGFTTLQASITAAKSAYQGQSTSASAGADASIKIALGTLQAAQAQLEKTFVRAPISGTINFLSLHVGDYVTQLSHVATVAQNGALEIVTYLSEDNRALISVGSHVTVEGTYPAVITSIAPALDPTRKQIEVHLALTGTSALVNGQTVRISLPNTAPKTTTATSTGPLLLPLAALKLTPAARVVFSVGEDGRLVAHQVEIGDVQGDRIEITTALSPDLLIVTDARGLSEGEKVATASTTP